MVDVQLNQTKPTKTKLVDVQLNQTKPTKTKLK